MTELLAPAGSFAALKAAIANGANAIYLGGQNYSARAFADNFSLEQIREAVRLAHFYDVKIYVTVNTLISDEEMSSVLSYIGELYRIGVDAVIVQDLGLLQAIRSALPDFPVHASTQMSVHNGAGCRLMEKLGAQRVILARELSFQDMDILKEQTTIGLETFVHGALCVCTSGQCLFSSMVGGRSGNRGRCAQPCRMAYRLVDDNGRELAPEHKGEYLLSPRDLVGYDKTPELFAKGLASWKIEGRMKKPEYVAIVTAAYREALDKLERGEELGDVTENIRRMLQVFNRDRNHGYWESNPGGELMSFARPNNRGVFAGRLLSAGSGYVTLRLQQPICHGDILEIWASGGHKHTINVDKIYLEGNISEQAQVGDTVALPHAGGREGDRVFKIFDAPLMEQARASMQTLPGKPLHFYFVAQLGRAFWLKAYDDDGYEGEYESEYIVEPARKNTADLTTVQVQLGRLGDTDYILGRVDGQMDRGVLLPPSVLNNCRRQVVEDILAQREKGNNRSFDPIAFVGSLKAGMPDSAGDNNKTKIRYSILAADAEQALLAADKNIGDIYIDAAGLEHGKVLNMAELALEMKKRGASLLPYLPQTIFPREEQAWLAKIAKWHDMPIRGIVANNIGQMHILQELGWEKPICAGMGSNCFNSRTYEALRELGASRIILSPELSLEQLQQMVFTGAEAEVFGQGALQVMLSEYCAAGAVCGGRTSSYNCSSPCKEKGHFNLRDEKGYVFPLRFDNSCRMHVFNSREHCLIKEMDALEKAGIDRMLLDIRLYDKIKANRLMELYQMAAEDAFSRKEAQDKVEQVMREYTKGHLYRGI